MNWDNQMEASSISPETFRDLVMPTWARVYLEVSSERNSGDLPWFADSVVEEFIALIGIDPRRAQFGTLEQQQRCLAAAREAREGLFHADEVAQKDGRPALDYAAGWMACRDLAMQLAGPPSIDVGEMMLTKALAGSRYTQEHDFSDGFRARYALQVQD